MWATCSCHQISTLSRNRVPPALDVRFFPKQSFNPGRPNVCFAPKRSFTYRIELLPALQFPLQGAPDGIVLDAVCNADVIVQQQDCFGGDRHIEANPRLGSDTSRLGNRQLYRHGRTLVFLAIYAHLTAMLPHERPYKR